MPEANSAKFGATLFHKTFRNTLSLIYDGPAKQVLRTCKISGEKNQLL